jgi:hypothetical protein
VRKATLLAALIVLASCGTSDDRNVEGWRLRESLSAALARADRVVVVEHSDPVDFVQAKPTSSSSRTPRIYRSVELDAPAKVALQSAVQQMSTKSADSPFCILEVHHTIELYVKEKLESRIDVCFQCGQVVWSAAEYPIPEGLLSALTPTILNSGMQGRRDWAALAVQHRDASR